MRRLMAAALCLPLMASTAMVASGQDRYHYDRDSHQRFYNGAYQGGRGGDYYGHDRRYDDYDRRYHQGGIGPGKGALIGGAGGAAVGALFTGSAKGAIIGGAAGAGIGAILGQHAQNERERRY
ncbi:MAG TPA: glycine zipper domain-containing protein [Acidobacteriaceae bacterium]